MSDYKILLHRAIKELPKDKFVITSKGEYKFAYVTTVELASMMNILIRKDGLSIKPISAIRARAEAKVEGYKFIRLASDHAIVVSRPDDEIERLKISWMKDPCWDIEDTDGFEYHYEELKLWREQRSREIEKEVSAKLEKRFQFVSGITGIGKDEKDLLMSLCTWSEIEFQVHRAETSLSPMPELAAAQVRATLLQAAQIKRLADAFEKVSNGGVLSVDKSYGL